MTQNDRILAALHRGPVSSTDFIRPVDGGKPILRVAARIKDLQDTGHQIASRRSENGTAIYTLHGVALAAQPTPDTESTDWRDLLPDEPQQEVTQGMQECLFDKPASGRGAYGGVRTN